MGSFWECAELSGGPLLWKLKVRYVQWGEGDCRNAKELQASSWSREKR